MYLETSATWDRCKMLFRTCGLTITLPKQWHSGNHIFEFSDEFFLCHISNHSPKHWHTYSRLLVPRTNRVQSSLNVVEWSQWSVLPLPYQHSPTETLARFWHSEPIGCNNRGALCSVWKYCSSTSKFRTELFYFGSMDAKLRILIVANTFHLTNCFQKPASIGYAKFFVPKSGNNQYGVHFSAARRQWSADFEVINVQSNRMLI